MSANYNTDTCQTACQAIDPILTKCDPDSKSGLSGDTIECVCADLNPPDNLRGRILEGCTVCDQEGLGNHTLADYQYYTVECSIMNSNGLSGGLDNADGNYEGGYKWVTSQFSTTCLPEIRGLPTPTPPSDTLPINCDKFDPDVQFTAISKLARELDLPLTPIGVVPATSAVAAASSTPPPASTILSPADSSVSSAAPSMLVAPTSASGAPFPSSAAASQTGISTPSAAAATSQYAGAAARADIGGSVQGMVALLTVILAWF